MHLRIYMAFYQLLQSADCTRSRGMPWADIDVTWLENCPDVNDSPGNSATISSRANLFFNFI